MDPTREMLRLFASQGDNTIISALKSEILIYYKRVNQMDPTRETLRLFASQGDNLIITHCNI